MFNKQFNVEIFSEFSRLIYEAQVAILDLLSLDSLWWSLMFKGYPYKELGDNIAFT